MRKRTIQGVDVFRRVYQFLSGSAIPAAIGPLDKHVEELGAVVERLSTHAITQESRGRAAQAATVTKRRLLAVLRQEFMRPVSRVARGLFPDDVEMQQALLFPRFKDHGRLLMIAYAMIDRMTPHAELFVNKGFAPDFLERFRKAADAVKAGVDARAADMGRRTASTVGQIEVLREGRELVRLIDAMVTPRLQSAPDRLAEWRSLMRFPVVSGSSEASTDPKPAPTPAPGPAPVVGVHEGPVSPVAAEVKAA